MKKIRVRVVAFLLCLLLVLNLCSCWSRRELGTLAIVLGTALDVGDEPDTVKLTSQAVKSAEIGSGASASGGGGASGDKPYANIWAIDKSVLSTIRKITHLSNRRLYYPHNQILIFSSELARHDIWEGLDAFIRDYEARMNTYILISRGPAAEILEEEPELEKIPALHITEMIKNQPANSETVVVTLRDFAIATLSPSTAPVAPIIEMYEMNGKKKARLEGTAVFKHGKMIGELDVPQTRGLMWVTGRAKAGVITVDTEWGQVVLEIVHSKTSLKPVKTTDGTIRIKLAVMEEGYIESNETTQSMDSLENVNMLTQLEQKRIHSDMEKALEQARYLSADIFCFGEAIRREYPKDWEKMKDTWDEAFGEIQVDTQVSVELRSTGSLTKPVVPGGGS